MSIIADSENINILWANLIVEELKRHGINYFCISPGSRSTPLTVSAARHTQVQTKIIFDERGAAFHAIGYARSAHKPAVLICTSGTAAANYYPAVIEASQENLPLIILSADRPAELRNTGANQTINQVELYGRYSRFFADIPCPVESIKPSWILSQVDRAVSLACKKTASGPVHLNCMFREPLAPEKQPFPVDYLKDIESWLSSGKHFLTTGQTPQVTPEISHLLDILNAKQDGIILAGRNENLHDQQAILKLAEKINWPVFADITSGLRLKKHRNIIHYFDQMLLSPDFIDSIAGKPILHFGGQFVSKRMLQFLEKHKAEHVQIQELSKNIDPALSVTQRIQGPISEIISQILGNVQQNQGSTFLKTLVDQNEAVTEQINNYEKNLNNPDEIAVARIVSGEISDNSALFIASSMPIRDMDMYAVPGNKNIFVGANRGASGIDGTIASALGFAVGAQKRITLLIGDLAFIHDLSSLSLLKSMNIPVTIVLVNNKGGGIFSFLPIADHTDIFEEYFGTPHTFTFDKIAETFGLNYFGPKTMQEFNENFISCRDHHGFNLIEVQTTRDENVKQHKALQESIQLLLSQHQ